MKYSKEQILRTYKKLSESDRDLFMAPETSEIVWNIAKKYDLSETQKSNLVDITCGAILKLDTTQTLVDSISTLLQIDIEKSTIIKNDLLNFVINKFGNHSNETHSTLSLTPAETETEHTNSIGQRLVSKNINKDVSDISQKHHLSENQRLKLLNKIQKVLGGQASIKGFRANLVQELGITYDQALKISSDVNQRIFAPVTETLKQVEGDIKKYEEEGESAENDQNTRNILETQIGDTDEQQNNFSPISQSLKTPTAQTTTITEPEKFIPTHEEMLKKEGPHLHSQTIMPASVTNGAVSSATVGPSYRKPEPPPQTARPFKSIVDQKLAGIVRSSSEPLRPANPSSDSKNPPTQNPTGASPRVPSSDNGYKGNDPYREPIE